LTSGRFDFPNLQLLPALVLTAGLGTRLDPITRLVAKPAVPVGERTLVEHVLAWLSRHHVTNVVLNLHHRPETIASVVGDGTHLGMRVRYSWEQPVLGSAGGPRRALPLLEGDPFLIVNGDTLCDFDLTALIDAHRQSNSAVTLAVMPNPDRLRYNGIRVGSAGEVLGFVPKGHTEETWHFVGVQVANKAMFSQLTDGVPSETVAGFYRDVIATEPGRIRAVPVRGTFMDVGTPADYLEAVLALAQAEGPGRAAVDARTRTFVWPSATVDATARLRNCLVVGDIRVPAGLIAENAVLAPASIERPGDRAERLGDILRFPLG
jgi:mannose-1-phosphate guanylyltransferase